MANNKEAIWLNGSPVLVHSPTSEIDVAWVNGSPTILSGLALTGCHRYWRLLIINAVGADNVSYKRTSILEMRGAKGGSDLTGSGTPSASSTYSTYVVANAFDGDTDTQWISDVSTQDKVEWVQYDFGSGNDVDIVEIYCANIFDRESLPNQCILQYSDDGSTWSDKYSWFDIPAQGDGGTYTYNDSTGNCVVGKDLIAKPMTSNSSLGQVTSASSELSSSYPAYEATIRGYTNDINRYISANGTTGWWKIDLGNAKTAVTLGISGLSERITASPTDFILEGSTDDSVWDTLLTVVDETWATTDLNHVWDLTSTGSYRYYRISWTDNGGYSYVDLQEVFLYEPAAVVNTVVNPVISPDAGAYGPGQLISITCLTPDSTIYYTVDGSTPTTSSTEYTGSFTLGTAKTVKAIAVVTGLDDSEVVSATYTIASYNAEVSKAVGYAVLSVPDGSVISKAVGYAVLSTEVNVGISKAVAYAVLEPEPVTSIKLTEPVSITGCGTFFTGDLDILFNSSSIMLNENSGNYTEFDPLELGVSSLGVVFHYPKVVNLLKLWGTWVTGFTIQGSNDGVAWTTLSTETNSTDGELVEFSFTNTTAYYYYRCLITGSSSTNVRFHILELWGDDTAQPTYTLPRLLNDVSSMDVSDWGYYADRLIDGELDDAAYVDPANLPLDADFDVRVPIVCTHIGISSADIYTVDDYCFAADYEFYGSANGTDWTLIKTFSLLDQEDYAHYKIIDVDNTTAYRYYRFKTVAEDGHYAELSELELYGTGDFSLLASKGVVYSVLSPPTADGPVVSKGVVYSVLAPPDEGSARPMIFIMM